MGIAREIAHMRGQVVRLFGRPDPTRVPGFHTFAGTPQQRRSRGELSDLFYAHQGRPIHKWDHYLPIYEKFFARFRGTSVRLLEIGVAEGGSLELWRKFLGPAAIIWGIDIDARCAAFDSPDLPVCIGSQRDPDFLRAVVKDMGGVDIVIDDGSHRAIDQKISFETCFSLLPPDGLYVAEDLHTSYWPFWDGGYHRAGTFLEEIKDIIDRMHGWHYDERRASNAKRTVGAVHIFDSIVILEKAHRTRPFHVTIGQPTSDPR